MAIEIYADLEEVAAEVAEVEVEVTAEVDQVDAVEPEPTDAPEASNQEEETEEPSAEVETPAATVATTWTRTTNESDLISQLVNAKRRYRTAEQEVEEIKEQLKEAKAHMEGCASRVMKIIDELENDAPENRPLFSNLEAKVEEVEGAAREEEPATEPDAADLAYENDNAWRYVSATELDDLTPAILEALEAGGVTTLGGLADLIEQVETGKAKWPKGIGKGKAEKIVNSLILWQDNNGAGVDAVDSRDVPVEPIYPTVEEWRDMTDKEQIAWLKGRAEVLASSEFANSEIDDPVWLDAYEAFNDDCKIENCELLPGEECDTWICGWLRAKTDAEE